MKGLELIDRRVDGTDLTTRKILGVDGFLERVKPRSEAAIDRHNGLGSAAFLEPERWRLEMARLHDLDHNLQDEGNELRECLGPLPTLERPFRRLDAQEILRDVDLFEIKRFLYHGTQLLERAAGLDRLPTVDSEIYTEMVELMDKIHPEETPTPRFRLSDRLDPTLAEARRGLKSLRKEGRDRRGELEAQILEKWDGKFDIHGRFKPVNSAPIADDLLIDRGESYEIVDRQLAGFLEKEAGAREGVKRLEKKARKRLTTYVENRRRELINLAERLVVFDLRLARVELRRAIDGCWPRSDDSMKSPVLIIEEGRDPLLLEELEEGEVQAIDLRLNDGATIVSGPNMGGKSALLRLVGIVQWCSQMALPVAAKAVSFTAVHKIVYVGSEQAGRTEADSGLSSFGREVHRFVEFWEEESPIMWLLDEPARGTHPEEGALLAQAIIDRRVARGDRLLVATHFPELARISAYTRLQIEGLQLDEKALRAEIESSKKENHSLKATLRRFMDYRVRPVDEGTVPRDAFTIAQALGLDLAE